MMPCGPTESCPGCRANIHPWCGVAPDELGRLGDTALAEMPDELGTLGVTALVEVVDCSVFL